MRKANEDIRGIHPLFRVNLAYLREMIGDHFRHRRERRRPRGAVTCRDAKETVAPDRIRSGRD
jgi:hypothetical protein